MTLLEGLWFRNFKMIYTLSKLKFSLKILFESTCEITILKNSFLKNYKLVLKRLNIKLLNCEKIDITQ